MFEPADAGAIAQAFAIIRHNPKSALINLKSKKGYFGSIGHFRICSRLLWYHFYRCLDGRLFAAANVDVHDPVAHPLFFLFDDWSVRSKSNCDRHCSSAGDGDDDP